MYSTRRFPGCERRIESRLKLKRSCDFPSANKLKFRSERRKLKKQRIEKNPSREKNGVNDDINSDIKTKLSSKVPPNIMNSDHFINTPLPLLKRSTTSSAVLKLSKSDGSIKEDKIEDAAVPKKYPKSKNRTKSKSPKQLSGDENNKLAAVPRKAKSEIVRRRKSFNKLKQFPHSTPHTKQIQKNLESNPTDLLIPIEKPINLREANRNVKVKHLTDSGLNSDGILPLQSTAPQKRKESASRIHTGKNLKTQKSKKSGHESLRRSRSETNLRAKDPSSYKKENSPVLSKHIRKTTEDNNFKKIPVIQVQNVM